MKYIGFYDELNIKRNNTFLSAINKMNYIAESIVKAGENVDIISCSLSAKEDLDRAIVNLNDGIKIHFLKAYYPRKNLLQKCFLKFKKEFSLLLYLLKNVKKGEKVIVYHSLSIMHYIKLLKWLKKIEVILEVEEFYNDVSFVSGRCAKKEEKFIKMADKYIFPTELLNQKYNKDNKPYVVVHGMYKYNEQVKSSFGDDKIHTVYSGTFEEKKVGMLIECTKYLSSKYHIHILGYGTSDEVDTIKNKINIANKSSDAYITYDGLLYGDDYNSFLNKCHIGLCIQDPTADFSNTSFPSKILSYMSNGLRVVSVNIPAIYDSAVGNKLYYCSEYTDKAIAEIIENIDFNDGYDSKTILNKLDLEFISDLKSIILN